MKSNESPGGKSCCHSFTSFPLECVNIYFMRVHQQSDPKQMLLRLAAANEVVGQRELYETHTHITTMRVNC